MFVSFHGFHKIEFVINVFLFRVDVCSLLLSHGADPSLLNCHSKSAVDVCPSDDLQEKLQCMITIKK